MNSLPSLLTSRFPFVDGIREYQPMRLKERETTIAETLKRHEYQTAAVIGWRIAGSAFGLSQGCDIFDEDHRPSESAERTVARAITRLETLREPFFLWLHIRLPHDPYEIPNDVFDSGQAPLLEESRTLDELRALGYIE